MTKTYALDLLERVAASFVRGALTVLGANGADITSLSVWQGAAIAGGAAVIALLKGLIAKTTGGKESAGLGR